MTVFRMIMLGCALLAAAFATSSAIAAKHDSPLVHAQYGSPTLTPLTKKVFGELIASSTGVKKRYLGLHTIVQVNTTKAVLKINDNAKLKVRDCHGTTITIRRQLNAWLRIVDGKLQFKIKGFKKLYGRNKLSGQRRVKFDAKCGIKVIRTKGIFIES